LRTLFRDERTASYSRRGGHRLDAATLTFLQVIGRLAHAVEPDWKRIEDTSGSADQRFAAADRPDPAA